MAGGWEESAAEIASSGLAQQSYVSDVCTEAVVESRSKTSWESSWLRLISSTLDWQEGAVAAIGSPRPGHACLRSTRGEEYQASMKANLTYTTKLGWWSHQSKCVLVEVQARKDHSLFIRNNNMDCGGSKKTSQAVELPYLHWWRRRWWRKVQERSGHHSAAKKQANNRVLKAVELSCHQAGITRVSTKVLTECRSWS